MKNVLIINQSSELYGADKALLELIENYPEGYTPIVVLEYEGPFKEILIRKNIRVICCPVIKLNSALFSFSGLSKLFLDTFKGLYILRKETKSLRIDFVHSNAISVLLGAFYSFLYRKKHLWHVHEIVERPKSIAHFYPNLVSFFSTRIIFNSNASFNQFFKIKPSIQLKSQIIHNGQERTMPASTPDTIRNIRLDLFKAGPDKIIIGLVGRISKRKGQVLLLDAFKNLVQQYDGIHLVFIGSPPPGQDFFLHELQERIAFLNLENQVTIVGFQENIWPIYDALDIAVVPSIESESFGLVATEAMLSSRPVIASNYGGLAEIVSEAETGFLINPGDRYELEAKIEWMLLHPEERKDMGVKGHKRVKEHFSTASFARSFANAYNTINS